MVKVGLIGLMTRTRAAAPQIRRQAARFFSWRRFSAESGAQNHRRALHRPGAPGIILGSISDARAASESASHDPRRPIRFDGRKGRPTRGFFAPVSSRFCRPGRFPSPRRPLSRSLGKKQHT